MATGNKQIDALARQFLKLSLVEGSVSPEHVTGVLAYVEKHRPPHAAAVLKAYRRLIAAEIARGQAVVEHAGPIDPGVLSAIAATMTTRYRRPVTSIARRNDALLAGLRVRVGDDVYESSVAGQLGALADAV
ncbi:MAG: F0F1 ATP synthase subunit delta [Opitutaceae bacterium]|nr:F0F1 ATP synthase subunit delta [Opitutaceae bacterium]